jgi:hypothetical protein
VEPSSFGRTLFGKCGVIDVTALVKPRRGGWKVAIFPSDYFSQRDALAVSPSHVQPQRTRPVWNFDDIQFTAIDLTRLGDLTQRGA